MGGHYYNPVPGLSETKFSEMRSVASQVVAKRSDPMKNLNTPAEIRDRAVQLLIECEKIIHRIGLRSQQLLLKLVALLKLYEFGIKDIYN